LGSLDGYSESGAVSLKAASSKPTDRTSIETENGAIQVIVPRNFAAHIDLWSLQGDVQVDLPVRTNGVREMEPGPHPGVRVQGRVHNGRKLVQLFSQSGAIQLMRSN